MTANTVPRRALPTGTGDPPVRRSKAFLTPITALGGAPIAAKCATTFEERVGPVRPSGRTAAAAPERGPRTENQHDRHSAQRPEQEDRCVKGEAGGTLGDPCLAKGGDRREQGGHRHGSDGTDEPDRKVLGHAERNQLAAICTEGGHGGVVRTLDVALTSQRLAHHRQSDECGESSQDPPSDGLRVDGGFNRSSCRVFI